MYNDKWFLSSGRPALAPSLSGPRLEIPLHWHFNHQEMSQVACVLCLKPLAVALGVRVLKLFIHFSAIVKSLVLKQFNLLAKIFV
jgi:hypothetical protein